jgi:hypothetical protein
MSAFKFEEKKINISIDVTELNDAQVRLIRTINTMLTHVMSTEEEDEFFDSSAELMKLMGTAVKQANFNSYMKKINSIPYAEQALEFSLDSFTENMQKKIIDFDN